MSIAYFMRAPNRIARHHLFLCVDRDPRNDGYLGEEFFQFRVSELVGDEMESLNESYEAYLNIDALRITLDNAGVPNDNFLDDTLREETLDISAQPWEAILPNLIAVERGNDD
jgi:hypothetical protein